MSEQVRTNRRARYRSSNTTREPALTSSQFEPQKPSAGARIVSLTRVSRTGDVGGKYFDLNSATKLGTPRQRPCNALKEHLQLCSRLMHGSCAVVFVYICIVYIVARVAFHVHRVGTLQRSLVLVDDSGVALLHTQSVCFCCFICCCCCCCRCRYCPPYCHAL